MVTLFCDLDGVLVNFEKGILDLTGLTIEEQSAGNMWKAVAKADNFFTNLSWMSDGQLLWANVIKYNPTILTGIPYGGWAAQQKRDWCAKELGSEVPVIPCWSKDKHTYGIEGDILIDDRISAKDKWESIGGVFIHHINAERTLDELQVIH